MKIELDVEFAPRENWRRDMGGTPEEQFALVLANIIGGADNGGCHWLADNVTNVTLSNVSEARELVLRPQESQTGGLDGVRLIYVMGGKKITSTFVPITGQGIMNDLAQALPQFAAMSGMDKMSG